MQAEKAEAGLALQPDKGPLADEFHRHPGLAQRWQRAGASPEQDEPTLHGPMPVQAWRSVNCTTSVLPVSNAASQ